MAEAQTTNDRATRRLWPALALPGTFWLIALFLVPTYAVMAVAFSGYINVFGEPIPAWNPLDWQFATFIDVLTESISGTYQEVWIRTGIFTLVSLAICVVVGYPVAYYTARLAGKRRGLVLALILAPVVDQLHHPDARVGQPAAGRRLREPPDRRRRHRPGQLALGQRATRSCWRSPTATCRSSSSRCSPRSTGSTSACSRPRATSASGMVRTFLHVTLPLSKLGLVTAMVITALPMAGDYYTNNIVSGSPNTNMIGNQIELFLLQGPLKNYGASLVLLLSLVLLFFMAYYLILTQRASKEAAP